MNNILFIKLCGAGNDFVLIDKKMNAGFDLSPEFIRNVCDRRYGIGADGLLVIGDSENTDFTMEYYNSDGSLGSLCGNGARCAIKYADFSSRLKNKTAVFSCRNVSYSGVVLDDELIRFNLNAPSKIKLNFKIKAFNQLINASFADTGSPHVVIHIGEVLKDTKSAVSGYSEISKFPTEELGREIRYHKDFAPGGTNVNFIYPDKDRIFIRTYERGVENETLACGTGSVASALIAYLNFDFKPPVKIITFGGEELVVNFNFKDGTFRDISLTGPAKITFHGELKI